MDLIELLNLKITSSDKLPTEKHTTSAHQKAIHQLQLRIVLWLLNVGTTFILIFSLVIPISFCYLIYIY